MVRTAHHDGFRSVIGFLACLEISNPILFQSSVLQNADDWIKIHSKKMLFSIVEDFGVASGDSWSSYIEWRGIHFECFESLDGMLRPSLFTPETAEDWDHVVCEDFMFSYIKDFNYAHQAHVRIGTGSLMGFAYSEHDETHEGFLGYDIIDGYGNVSLLTNWGNDVVIVNRALASNALVPTLAEVESIRNFLTSNHSDDGHVEGCRIVSVYSTVHLKKRNGRHVGPPPT